METKEFKENVEAVAKLLNFAVEFNSDDDMKLIKRAYLTDGHKEIIISNGGYQNQGKLRVRAGFPKTEKGETAYYGEPLEIGVSETRSPDRIARDIERRLMPEYLKALKETIIKIEKINFYNKRQIENLKKLADYFGVEFKTEERNRLTIWVYNKIPGLGSTIEACDGDTVKFSLEVKPEIAIKIFDLMKLT